MNPSSYKLTPSGRALLWLYLQGSAPLRAWRGSRRARAGMAPVMVLFYHRVADEHPNAWTMPTATFARQMRLLRRRFDVVSLAEAQRRIRAGRNDRPAVSVTFDDGYADNCRFALPLLIAQQMPCTYFVTSGNVLSGEAFPHDAECGVPLAPNTPEQIRDLAAAGIEIGAHTRTHVDLGSITDRGRLESEITGSKQDLEKITGRAVRYFAFPYGLERNMSTAALQVAVAAGFEGVCSAYGGYNFPGDGGDHLQRIHGDVDTLRLRNWLSVDERKVRSARPALFDLDLPNQAAAQEAAADLAGVLS